MERSYDAVMVGLGFGGGVAACVGWRGLGGESACSSGRRFGRGDFPDRPAQAPQLLWHPKVNTGGCSTFVRRLKRRLVAAAPHLTLPETLWLLRDPKRSAARPRLRLGP